MKTIILFAASILIISTACAKEIVETTGKGLFQVTLSSRGEILRYGRNDVVVLVTDPKGQPVEHATIDIVPWMPEHNHGTMWPPSTIEQGKGIYRSVIALNMTGHWQLKVTVRKGDIEDSVTFDFPDVKE